MTSGCTPTRTDARGRPRSRATRWRVVVLLGVHVLIAIHLAHWMTTGRTVSPLEPSEAQEFARHGVINAGLIFFALATLSTLVLGRFFCGWACHLVALQDLCRGVLLRVGIRPRPLRSRALALVPLLAFGYMFLLPFLLRHGPSPAVTTRLTTTDFWGTFPPWWGALITFAVCGFVVVYLLGAKGFCTYACPYGALFGAVDRFAPGRIRVTDACEGCGLCTANCSSNVDVKREVATHRMVVDPGCMKCLDCVSVCPKGALYFGFGKPAGLGRRRGARRGLPWAEEALAAGLFVGVFLGVRGLYGVVPFLLALGLAAAAAGVGLVAWRFVRGRDARLPGLPLREEGRATGAGRALVGLGALGLVFVAHSLLVQWHGWRSARAFETLEGPREDYFSPRRSPLAEAERSAARSVVDHGERALALGLLSDARRENEVGWARLLLGDGAAFERHLERAVAATRRPATSLLELGNHARAGGDLEGAAAFYRRALDHDPDHPFAGAMLRDVEVEAHVARANAHLQAQRPARAEDEFGRALALVPAALNVRAALAELRVARGDQAGALALLEEGCRVSPQDAAPLRVLAFTQLMLGDPENAADTCSRAEALPDPQGETARLRAAIDAAR